MQTYLRDNKDTDRVELVSPGSIHDIPLTRSRTAARRDKGSRLLTLHQSNSREPKERKLSTLPPIFRLAETV